MLAFGEAIRGKFRNTARIGCALIFLSGCSGFGEGSDKQPQPTESGSIARNNQGMVILKPGQSAQAEIAVDIRAWPNGTLEVLDPHAPEPNNTLQKYECVAGAVVRAFAPPGERADKLDLFTIRAFAAVDALITAEDCVDDRLTIKDIMS